MDELRTLVEHAQKGDLDAYGEIVRRFQDMAFGYAYAILGDFHLAQDAAQEAFIQAYRDLGALRLPAAFPGWFRRIVFKHCDRLTRRRPLRTVALDAAAGAESADVSPAEAAERREMRDAVLTAIRSLPDHERTVTTLFYIDGYSQKDIAEFLEVPVTTVDGRLRTARRGLKERMLSMVDETLKSFGLPERFADVVVQMTFVIRRIEPLAESLQSLTDEQLASKSATLKRRLAEGENRDSIKAEAFALVREASRRAWDKPLYDVQLVAGLILDQGWVAEVASGEGKTISCLPAAYMGVLEGMHVHIATVNYYLARRDAEFAETICSLLGVTVGCLTSDRAARSEEEGRTRRQAYESDITYGWNAEFGFDHLRDTIRAPGDEKVQGTLDFAIIDEVDSVLIDEARTPLSIARSADSDPEQYRKADAVVRELISKGAGSQGTDLYEVDRDNRYCIHLTADGVAAAEELPGVGSFSAESNVKWPNLIEQALRAHLLYEKDREYVVKDGKVMILDESTGRVNPGREWSDGLHQAVECKEGLEIRGERKEEAAIRLQDYFRLYKKLAGVTGTAKQQASWFRDAYGMDVALVPTRYPMNRVDHDDRVYPDAEAKCEAIVEEVRHYSRDLRRPVLVGTRGIRESEKLSDMLTRHRIRHQILNARSENAAREAEIIASAGRQEPLEEDPSTSVGAVTIANMAGRGTAIDLGPNAVHGNCKVPSPETVVKLGAGPEKLFPAGVTKCCINCPEYDEKSQCAHCFKPQIDADFPHRGRAACRKEPPCGLHVIGAGRAMARRLDDQLRARAGRQGQPGSSRFFVSLQDEVMQLAVEEPKAECWLTRLDENGIGNRRVSAAIERAQKEAEKRNFEIMRALDGAKPRADS